MTKKGRKILNTVFYFRGVAKDGGTRGGISVVSPIFGLKIGIDQKKGFADKLAGIKSK